MITVRSDWVLPSQYAKVSSTLITDWIPDCFELTSFEHPPGRHEGHWSLQLPLHSCSPVGGQPRAARSCHVLILHVSSRVRSLDTAGVVCQLQMKHVKSMPWQHEPMMKLCSDLEDKTNGHHDA